MVRNYDTPAPARVVANLRRVLSQQDMSLLQKGSYELLITHCGFIAHYDHQGFVATYQDDLPSFVDQFLNQMGLGWDIFLDNQRSYLYDVSYKGKMLADIIRELVPIFVEHRPLIESAHRVRAQEREEAALKALAQRLGYDLVKRDP